MGEIARPNPDVLSSATGPEQTSSEGSLSYRERLRQGLGQLAEGSISLLNLAAGIVLARDDLRLTRQAMDHLDEAHDGIISRQAESPELSMQLEADIILSFGRDTQRAGFSDPYGMSAEQRSEVAWGVAEYHADDIADELAAANPAWTEDEIQEAVTVRQADIATLLSMTEEEYDAYLADELQYHELRSATAEIQAELSELRAERAQRLSRIGSVALQGVVSFAGRVRDLPAALSARAVVAGMSMSERLHNITPENRRRAFWGTAAGVAIGGLATYIAMRHGHGSGSGGYNLASSSSPLTPDHAGTGISTPGHAGTLLPGHGAPSIDHAGASSNYVIPAHAGTTITPDHAGTMFTPDHAGMVTSPDHAGTIAPTPNHAGSAGGVVTPNHAGTVTTPNHAGVAHSADLSGATTSHELFGGSGSVDKWPDVITVNHWDSKTLDGSLTGISRQMLVRSGVHSPTQDQINSLISSLRPQAQPNGYLLQGQKLDLRPAAKILQSILKS